MCKKPIKRETFLDDFSTKIVTMNDVIEATDGRSIDAFDRNKSLLIYDYRTNLSTKKGLIDLRDVEIHQLSDLKLDELKLYIKLGYTYVHYVFDELWLKSTFVFGSPEIERDKFVVKLVNGKLNIKRSYASRFFTISIRFSDCESEIANGRLTEAVRDHVRRIENFVSFPTSQDTFHSGLVKRLVREASLTSVLDGLLVAESIGNGCVFDGGSTIRLDDVILGQSLSKRADGKVIDYVSWSRGGDGFASRFVVHLDKLKMTSDVTVTHVNGRNDSSRHVDLEFRRFRVEVFYRRPRGYEAIVEASGLELTTSGRLSSESVGFVRREFAACLKGFVQDGLESALNGPIKSASSFGS